MIKQLQYSESVGPPSDQKTARGALRLLGAFEADTAILDVSSSDIFADKVRRELRELEAQVDDRPNVTRDPALHNRIERLRGILKEYER